MGLFNENEILLMIGVVSVLLFSILVLALLDLKDRLKEKKKHVVVADESVSFGEKLEEEPVVASPKEDMVEVLELEDEVMINDVKEEVNDAIVEALEEPKEEVLNVVEEKKINLQEELEKAINSTPKEDAITNFELEQERTAIISLDELMEKSNDLYNSNEVMQYDDGDEPISIEEVMNRFNTQEEKSVPEIMQDIVEDGNNMSFENTATYEKLSRSTDKDFITKLREVNENK